MGLPIAVSLFGSGLFLTILTSAPAVDRMVPGIGRSVTYSEAMPLVGLDTEQSFGLPDGLGFGQQSQIGSPLPPGGSIPLEGPCCGPISSDGQRLIAAIDSLDVEHHWLAHQHVYWKTGAQDRGVFLEHETHCSSFVAAVGYRLRIYLLRPPQHPIEELQGAQARWILSSKARERGWIPVTSMKDAQRRANIGEFVVVFYVNPDRHRAGHIAVVRPSEKSAEQLIAEGPETTQAGDVNHRESFVARGFHGHPGAFPNGVHYYAHSVNWGRLDTSIDGDDDGLIN